MSYSWYEDTFYESAWQKVCRFDKLDFLDRSLAELYLLVNTKHCPVGYFIQSL